MNKMIAVAFKNEDDAYEGLDALKDIHTKGDLTLYATAVLTKKLDGQVEVKQAADKGPVGTVVGMLTGALVGVAVGPAAAATTLATDVAIGSTAGGLGGLLYDTGRVGVNADFVDEVSALLIPGHSVVVAEVEEEWVTPMDTKMTELGGVVFRFPRYEFIEDQMELESMVLNAELKEIEEELRAGNTKAKSATEKTLATVKDRLRSIYSRAEERLAQVNAESKSKIEALKAQMKEANDRQKAKISERIDEIKAKQQSLSDKLKKTKANAKEALAA